jgi:8-oxo-dGTP diphosphatase
LNPKNIIDVTAAIMYLDGKIFAAKRARGKHLVGMREFPGGKVEQDETNDVCLKRELMEEFGITVEIGDFFGESNFDYGDKKIRLLAYNTRYLSGDFNLTDHDEVCWAAPEELPNLEWAPADLPFVAKLSKE